MKISLKTFLDLFSIYNIHWNLIVLFNLDWNLNKHMRTKMKTIFSSIFFTSVALMILFFSQFFIPPNEISLPYYITIGTVIAAFIGILPALSIIPIQKAGEAWSPIIIKFYKDDLRLKWALRGLGIVSLTYFVLGISSLPFPWGGFLFLGLCGMSFDLVVYYYHTVCGLLDPDTACETLSREAEKIISDFQSKAQKDAKKDLDKEKGFYQGDKFEDFKRKLFFFSNELGLIGYKAAISYEYNTVQVALNKLVKITQCYAKNRKYNFSPDLYSGDSDRVIYSICEDINNIFKVTLRNQDKKIIEMVFNTYREVISALFPISFRITLEKYNNKDEYGKTREDIFIIGLREFYQCKESMLRNFPAGTEEINSLSFYNSFFEATKITASNLTDLQKFCFYTSIIRRNYNYSYNQHSEEDKFNYYLMIGLCMGAISLIGINASEITESDMKAISVILDADEWLGLIKEISQFFNNPNGLSFSWHIKTIKKNMKYLKSKFQGQEEEKKIDAIITKLDEFIS